MAWRTSIIAEQPGERRSPGSVVVCQGIQPLESQERCAGGLLPSANGTQRHRDLALGRDVAGVLRDVSEEVLLKALKLGEAQSSATVGFVQRKFGS